MSFPKYPEYKDSGVEWLGEVPAHWKIEKLKFLFKRVTRDVAPDDGIVTCFRDGEVTLRKNRRTEGFTNALKEIGYQGIRKGDLVIHAMDAFAGAIGVSDSNGKASPVYSVCVPRSPGVEPSYYGFQLRNMALTGFVESLAKGIRERSTDFRWNDAGEVVMPVPTHQEQERITSFLNHETGKIDALIEEQRRLIELLKEKRQAVISHAVTKGLDPNVPMKDSGVEWLGEVPAHWGVKKATYLGALFGSESVSEDLVVSYGHLPYLKVSSLASEGLSLSSIDWFLDASVSRRYRPYKDFIVFPKRGAAIFLNKVNMVVTSALLDPNLMGWKINAPYCAKYLAYALKARKLDELADVSTVPQINAKHIGPERFPTPPAYEQREIVAWIEVQLSKIEQLTSDAELGNELLNERRSALISAAVTGQIDIRGWSAGPARNEQELPMVAEQGHGYAAQGGAA